MFRPDFQTTSNSFSLAAADKEDLLQPKLPYASAVKALAKQIPALEADFDHFGSVRSLTSSAPEGLYKSGASASPARIARQFLARPIVERALGLRHSTLKLTNKTSFGFGYRVDFRQVAPLYELDQMIPVRGGGVSVCLDRSGRVFSVTSTLRRGRRPSKQSGIISIIEAVDAAAAIFCQPIAWSNCQLVYSSHKGQMDLAYEVTLHSTETHNVVTYLVLAKSGRVVDQQFRLLRSWPDRLNLNAVAKALLCTPQAFQPILPQASRTIISCLPDANVLRNDYFAMFLGHERQPVYAKADGTYCYGVNDPEFAAVSVFIALNSQLTLYRELGMSRPKRVLSVFVNDPTVEDNAYFDPINYEIRIGVGSGVARGGLTKRIAFDLGVANHEFGHNAVFLQTPGHDLPGQEGAAMHEATGDVLGTLLMDYLYRIWYARELGREFTVRDLVDDHRLVGKFALPPNGLRSQLNKKRYPNDLTGTPHSDGLIAGGAFADVMVGMATSDGGNLEDKLRQFGRINLTALALVPMHKVSFKDMLRAFVTADQLETGGRYRELIEQSFADHGIILGAYTKCLNDKVAA
jgi:hypothetical protein